jgi:hypothetical protein
MAERLCTVSDVVDALGGNLGVAAITGVKHTSAISNWKRIGKFPAKTHKILQDALHERSMKAPDDLWGIIHG